MDAQTDSDQSARRTFSLNVKMLTLIWLIVALVQWVVISTVVGIGEVFRNSGWICLIFFALSIILSGIFLIMLKFKLFPSLKWPISILIIESVIIGVYTLAARTHLLDLILWFAICALLLYIFFLIGSAISVDLTQHVVILLVVAFVILTISVFLIMLYLVSKVSYLFILCQVLISAVALTFDMFHAQTIEGGRYVEMRIDNYIFATIVLFFNFMVMFMLTFYVQSIYKLISGGETKTTVENLSTSLLTTTPLTTTPLTTMSTTTLTTMLAT